MVIDWFAFISYRPLSSIKLRKHHVGLVEYLYGWKPYFQLKLLPMSGRPALPTVLAP
jgi:hypothetical protein